MSELFTSKYDNLDDKQKSELKKLFNKAQNNNSPMWQHIISFDTDFLKECGVYNDANKQLNESESKIKELTRSTMKCCLKEENMEASALWSAAIHYNTKHIHVHIAMVEPIPTREQIINKKQTEYRAKFKPQTLNKMKSQGISILNEDVKTLKELNNTIRNNLATGVKSVNIDKDKDIFKLLTQVYHQLPNNKSLWNYNQKALNNIRPLIDTISQKYIYTYHKKEFQEFTTKLIKTSDFFRKAYGDSGRSYYDNKIKDLYSRMGNSILKVIKNYDHLNRIEYSIERQNKVSKGAYKKGGLRYNRHLSLSALYSSKRQLKRTFENQKNLNVHEQLMKDINQKQYQLEQDR